MKANALSAAFEIGEKIAEKQGVYLVDVSYDREKDGNYLRLYIDKPDGVGILDCESFSVEFDKEFDENSVSGNYCLEVSSPGADRTLKKEREFLYYIGREVDVKLYSAFEGLKEFTAELKSYEKEEIGFSLDGKEISIPKSNIVYVKLSFKF